MAQKKTPVNIRQSDGTMKTGYIGADNLSYYDDNTRVSAQTGASSVLKGEKEFKVPGSGQTPAYGSNISNFNPDDPTQKQLADLGQLWWQAKTKEERDAIAKQGQDLRTSLGEGKTQFNPLTGTTTFVGGTGGGAVTGGAVTGGAVTGGAVTGGGRGGSFAWDAYNDADAQARNFAQSKVDRHMSESRDSITNFLERLKSTREQSLRSAETSAEQQRQALQGRGFLQSRAAQQAMTERGMTGSGLAADAQTRLALQGQQELSQMYSDLSNKRFNIEEQYRLTEEEKLRELQTLEANKSNLTEEEYQNALDRIYARTNQRLSALFQEANLTGNYNGQRTLAGQQFDRGVFESDRNFNYQQARDAITDQNWKKQFDENVRQFGLNYAINEAQVTGKFQGQNTLAGRQVGMQERQQMAELTGTYVDANGNIQKTTAQQQQDLANLWTLADQTGQISPALANFYRISPNTSTLAAKQLAANQSNQRVQNSLDVWKATGKAPKGLEAYGVKEGTAFYTPEQQGAVGNGLSQQAAEGKLSANQFAQQMLELYGVPPVLNQSQITTAPWVPAQYGEPKLPTNPDVRYNAWINIINAGYDYATQQQIMAFLGLTADEIDNFMTRVELQQPSVNPNLPWNQ